MTRTSNENPKDALGRQKVSLAFFPNVARIQAAEVFRDSAPNYGKYNWRNNPVSFEGYLDAIERHIVDLRSGQNVDRKSGKHHLAHVIADAALLLDADAVGCLIDDRMEKDMAGELLEALTPKTYDRDRAKVKPKPARTLAQVRTDEHDDPAEHFAAPVKPRRRAKRR